jgi:hypothetical protein
MDTSVFGSKVYKYNSVPERSRWLIWTVCSYYIYGEYLRERRILKRARD